MLGKHLQQMLLELRLSCKKKIDMIKEPKIVPPNAVLKQENVQPRVKLMEVTLNFTPYNYFPTHPLYL